MRRRMTNSRPHGHPRQPEVAHVLFGATRDGLMAGHLPAVQIVY
jgi:hypothetical protein